MNPSFIILALAATLVVAASGSARLLAAPASSSAATTLPPAARPGQTTLYGHVKSLARKGDHFEMRFDPAWWLTGVTAQRAALADTGSSDVPNDYYIVEEGHRLLTYVVPTTAHVTVLTRNGVGIPATAIPVSELAQIVKGKNPKHRQLMEPKAGFWILIGSKFPSPRLSLGQQYQP